MKRRTRRRHEVAIDIWQIGEYIARDSLDAAVRFFDNVEATIRGLAAMPGKGARLELTGARLADLRSYSVKGFPNHLVIYRPLLDGIEIVAVLHGSREIRRILRKRP